MIGKLILVLVALVSDVLCQTDGTFYSCDFISSFENCNSFITGSYCGTNVITYANKCEFSKAHCADPTIDLLHAGDCSDIDIATAKPVAGSDVVMDFFCTSLSKQDCPVENTKVCGSDGRPYPGFCEYEKAKCTHRELIVVSYGACP